MQQGTFVSYLEVTDEVPSRNNVIFDSFASSFECGRENDQYKQNNVGEDGREVGNLQCPSRDEQIEDE